MHKRIPSPLLCTLQTCELNKYIQQAANADRLLLLSTVNSYLLICLFNEPQKNNVLQKSQFVSPADIPTCFPTSLASSDVI